MNSSFTAAIRRAAALTRDGSLGEATRIIQEALRTPGSPHASEAHGRRSGNLIPSPTILDLTAVRSGDRSPSAIPSGQSGSDAAAAEGVRQSGRSKRPLAETIRDLAAGRRSIGGLQPGTGTAGAPPVPEGAQYLSREFTSPAGGRSYRIYIPEAAAGGAKGLVMMLHGCKQNPDDFATGTAMNSKAGAAGMIVVYPRQPTAANPSACWNWFNGADQRRGSGEPAILAALARSLADEFAVPKGAVFVGGLSAGGAMAAILAETYPDVFSAAGIHSGLPAGAADDMASAFAAMAGKRRSGGPPQSGGAAARLIVLHGTADSVVHPSNGEAIVAPRRHRAVSTDRQSGRTVAGRRFERIVYRAADGRADVEHWILEGQGHAWSGGHSSGSYTDPAGPDASAEMLRFFQEGSPA